MKMAEFLNLDTKQVQWLDASLEHPNLVKVPEGAETITTYNSGNCVNFWKDNGDSWFSGMNNCWKQWWCMDSHINNHGHTIIWKRQTPLRQKVDEAKQKLGMNERQLSKVIGREESYITKMFVGSRNPKPKTIETLIADLDRLMKPKPKPKDVLKTITVQLSIDTKEVQDEIKKAYGLVDQANKNAEMYRHKCEAQANLIKWMGGLITLLLILGIAMVTL